MRSQEKKDAGLVLDVALGMVACASGVPASEWQEVCGEHASRLREEYDALVSRVREECGEDPVDMDMLRSLRVESSLWSALEDMSSGQDALGECLAALEDMSSEVSSPAFPRPCGEVWDASAGVSSSECVRRASSEWDAEAVFLGRGDMSEALRAVVRAELYECAAEEASAEDVPERVRLAVADWVESGRVSSCPACSVCSAGCASCVRAWLS